VVAARRWRYVEPGDDGVTPVWHELTEAEIIATYFAWWSGRMRQAGKSDLISEDACIDDWVVVHWAALVEGPDSLVGKAAGS
jgi:hypothetical protein